MSRDPWAAYSLSVVGIEDEFDRVMGGEAVRHPVHGGRGGEWDTLRRLPRRSLRILTGARLLTPDGLFPDEAATHVIGPKLGLYDTCEAMDWFARTGLAMIAERRQRRNVERHLRVAKRAGFPTYYDYRNARSIEKGYRSLYDERVQRWERPPTAPAR
jgi:hypothetical protein